MASSATCIMLAPASETFSVVLGGSARGACSKTVQLHDSLQRLVQEDESSFSCARVRV